jgi:hypothetical protein
MKIRDIRGYERRKRDRLSDDICDGMKSFPLTVCACDSFDFFKVNVICCPACQAIGK